MDSLGFGQSEDGRSRGNLHGILGRTGLTSQFAQLAYEEPHPSRAAALSHLRESLRNNSRVRSPR
jgi:hypothetical protein